MASIISAGTSTNTAVSITGDTTGALALATNNGTTAVTIDASQNVGIGTTSPRDVAGYVSLGLNDTTGALLDFYANGTRVGGLIGVSGSLQVGTVTTAPLVFNTNTNEVMRIDSSGNVGIGTTSPANKLTLNSGFVQTGNGVGGGGGVWLPTSTASTDCRTWRVRTDIAGYGDFGVEQSTTQNGVAFATRFLINQTGQIGFGSASPAAGNTLKVFSIGSDNAAQFGSSGSSGVYLPYASPTSWSAYSDARLKDVIGDYENALDHILQLNPVKYTFKADANKKVNIGLLAQNVLEVVPEIVDENTLPDDSVDKTRYLSLRYTDLIPVLIGAIQELKTIVDAQAVEIAALKAKVGS